MLKRLSYILVAALTLCGCNKENNETGTPEQELLTFTVSAVIDNDRDVRANLDETDLDVLWQKGDRIGLVDASGNITPAVLADEDAGTTDGLFEYQAASAIDILYAYYPYTGNETCVKGILSMSLPRAQTHVSEGFVAVNTLIMAGKYSDGGLVFNNACAVVQLNIKGEENYLRKVEVRCPGANLSGEGTMDLSADNPKFKAAEVAETSFPVEIDLGSQRLHMDSSEAATVYMVLPAGAYAGLTVEILGNTDETGTSADSDVSVIYKSSKEVTLDAGKVRPLNVTMTLPSDATVYGRVLCSEKPVSGVVVTDGENVVTTDADGYYSMSSAKPHGMVYLTVPSGYEVARGYGAVPQFYRHTVKAADVAERIDFVLIDDGDQTNHTMLLIGDIQLMNQSNDLNQFTRFIREVNGYVASDAGSKVYAMTLGDLTWDSYWYWNNFMIQNYLEYSDKFSINVWNTVGNHDNDLKISDDWACMDQWRKYYGPTYWSRNIGNVHYISLDNVYTHNGGTVETRAYDCRLTDQIQTWLKNDLALVDKDTPIVVAMHLPLLNPSGGTNMSGDDDMDTYRIIDAFFDYSDVRYFSAHTHTVYNNVDADVINWTKFQRQPVREQNVGSVCCDYWYSGNVNQDLAIMTDGSPSGYRIMKVAGKSMKPVYKAAGKRDNYFFRAYDRNSICITSDKYIPSAGPDHKAEFEKYLDEFAQSSSENYVYIYVWDWYDGWSISVSEGTETLAVTDLGKKTDPLFLISSTASRCNKADGGTFTLTAPPTECQKVFRVAASSATSTLTIKVSDPFGNSDTQVMTRPRPFSVAEYACDGAEGTTYHAPSFGLDDAMNL